MLLYWHPIWQTHLLGLKHCWEKMPRSCVSVPTPQEEGKLLCLEAAVSIFGQLLIINEWLAAIWRWASWGAFIWGSLSSLWWSHKVDQAWAAHHTLRRMWELGKGMPVIPKTPSKPEGNLPCITSNMSHWWVHWWKVINYCPMSRKENSLFRLPVAQIKIKTIAPSMWGKATSKDDRVQSHQSN